MSDRFTAEQRAAIEAEGRTIVSASAGSGKTTVMIEKIIR
jgi:ATP-dependent exoDNAse (exonuclease V) beta subunit